MPGCNNQVFCTDLITVMDARFDGNKDGRVDFEQSNVISVPGPVSGTSLTVERVKDKSVSYAEWRSLSQTRVRALVADGSWRDVELLIPAAFDFGASNCGSREW